MEKIKVNEFVNEEYANHPTWAVLTPKGYRYDHGTITALPGGRSAVYDGATNLVGYIRADGTFESASTDGTITEYQASFLRAAAKGGTPVVVDDE
jgi:hypothetical protein